MLTTALGYIFFFYFYMYLLHIFIAPSFSFFLDEILYVNQPTSLQILLIHVGSYSHIYTEYACMM